jgi:2-polyprenyl-3-methyl-5-hydroxy-6-metoxy-1,4-benzoquinol methylase
MIQETSYGIVKRLQFIEREIREVMACREGIVRIVDIGCGTGLLLTLPLAQSLGERAVIYAYDADRASLSYLQRKMQELQLSNLILVDDVSDLKELDLDVVIASEVVEHTEEPEEFVRFLRSALNPTGRLVLTLPNGYGWFEIDTMLYNTLQVAGIISLLRALKRLLTRHTLQRPVGDTLASSPHINFFTLAQIRSLLASVGMRTDKVQGRTFVCGSFVDRFIAHRSKTLALNNYLGSKLPLALVSGWMIVAVVSNSNAYAEYRLSPFQRLYTRYKRFVNRRSQARAA